MAYSKLITMYNLTASINTAASGATAVYSELADGIDNIAEALNEVVKQYFFLKDNGFAQNHVTGMAPAWTLTGRRVLGDAAQEFIFGNKYGLDTERQTTFKLEYTNASNATVSITVPCTICNIQEFSGATIDDAAISFEIRFDGPPTVA